MKGTAANGSPFPEKLGLLVKLKVVITLCLLTTLLTSSAYSEVNITGSSLLARGFGNTGYVLDALVEIENNPGDYEHIRSELEFPLDANLAGVTLAFDTETVTGKKWGAEIGLITNIGDPSSPMTDSDWQSLPGGFYGKTSYIESGADLNMISFSAEAHYQIYRFKKTTISVLTYCSYQKISQDMTGYQGWRINSATLQQQPISSTEPIIEYDVTYLSPQLGLKAAIELSSAAAIECQASSGLVFASDTDNHLTRGKLSEAEAVGLGITSQIKFHLLPGFALWRHLSLDIVGRFSYYTAEGDQTQRWYKDEGSIPAGTEITDIPHEFESIQYTIGAQIGISFAP